MKKIILALFMVTLKVGAMDNQPVNNHSLFVKGPQEEIRINFNPLRERVKQFDTSLRENKLNKCIEFINNFNFKILKYKLGPIYLKIFLLKAAEHGKLDIVKLLLRRGADVDAKEDMTFDGAQRQETVLMKAVHSNNCVVVDFLLNAGANVNGKQKYGETALMYAVKNRSVEVITLLLKAGADINVQNNQGRTALIYGIRSPETTQALLDAGADVS